MLTHEEKASFLSEHFQYEIGMLLYAYRVLTDNDDAAIDPQIRNIFIDAFYLHARNLYEFFASEAREKRNGTASVRHFINKSGENAPSHDKELLSRINSHASHLSYRRTTNADKMCGGDVAAIMTHLCECILWMGRNIRGEYAELFNSMVTVE